MTIWSALTTTEVLAQFNDSETTAYDTSKGDSTQASLTDIITKVSDQIVQAYADAGRLIDPVTGLSPANGTIPPGEKNRAIALVRWKYLLAIPTGKSLAENRAEEAKKAEEYLLLVAQRKFKFSGVATKPGRRLHPFSFDAIGQT